MADPSLLSNLEKLFSDVVSSHNARPEILATGEFCVKDLACTNLALALTSLPVKIAEIKRPIIIITTEISKKEKALEGERLIIVILIRFLIWIRLGRQILCFTNIFVKNTVAI